MQATVANAEATSEIISFSPVEDMVVLVATVVLVLCGIEVAVADAGDGGLAEAVDGLTMGGGCDKRVVDRPGGGGGGVALDLAGPENVGKVEVDFFSDLSV